jgi:hypothetical protein
MTPSVPKDGQAGSNPKVRFADHPGAGWIVDVAKGKKLDDFAEEEPVAIVKPVFLEGESPQAGRHGRTT